MADSIPLRALNQVTYCPRLYYLQYVDCVMPTNEHVESGLHDHRRVDDPALANRARKEGDAVRSRGVRLSSDALGIAGVLDVVEEKAGESYPVETKHGSAPTFDGKAGVWDNDAVQLCAQAMLLEEATGKPVARGYQFYAGTRDRVEVRFDDELRHKTTAAIGLCRELSSRDAPPPPLPAEHRGRCFGCSLAPVCLPEETMYEIGAAKGEEPAVPPAGLTRVIPASDDGAVLYLQEPGSHVGKRSETLVVRKDGAELSRIPMHSVRQVVVFGNVQLSTQALETLAANDVPVAYVTGYGRFIGSFVPAMPKNVGLREAQFRRFAEAAECLKLSKAAVRAKLTNQRALLMRSLRGEDKERGSQESAARGMADLLKKVESAASVESLLGLEGMGAALYFGEFGRFLKATPGEGFDFRTRNRRPPRDPVNALLSFAYAMLAKDCFTAVSAVGFDPYKGFFHSSRHGKPSLALDLCEEFRPVIADSVVLRLVNNEMVTKADFVSWEGACSLTEEGRKAFFRAYETRKSELVTHPVYGYKMSYGRMLEVQARMLAAYVRGTVPEYRGFVVR